MLNRKFSILHSMNMGERIKFARKAAGLIQAELGREVGVSKGAVSQWEHNDVKNVRMANLFAIEDATKFNARWIALGEGPEKVGDTPITPALFDEKSRELGKDELSALLRFAADQISRE